MEPTAFNSGRKTFAHLFTRSRSSGKKPKKDEVSKDNFTKCQGFAEVNSSDALIVLPFIKKETNVEQLRKLFNSCPNYRLWHGNHLGDHALLRAAEVDNIILIKHIVFISKEYLNLGNTRGWIPLHGAVFQRHIDATKVLIELGSPINTIGNADTPLSIALARGCSLELITFLIFCRAKMPIPYRGLALENYTFRPMSEVFKLVEQASEICMQYRLLVQGSNDKQSLFNTLPKDLIFIITDTLCGDAGREVFIKLKSMFPEHEGF